MKRCLPIPARHDGLAIALRRPGPACLLGGDGVLRVVCRRRPSVPKGLRRHGLRRYGEELGAYVAQPAPVEVNVRA